MVVDLDLGSDRSSAAIEGAPEHSGAVPVLLLAGPDHEERPVVTDDDVRIELEERGVGVDPDLATDRPASAIVAASEDVGVDPAGLWGLPDDDE